MFCDALFSFHAMQCTAVSFELHCCVVAVSLCAPHRKADFPLVSHSFTTPFLVSPLGTDHHGRARRHLLRDALLHRADAVGAARAARHQQCAGQVKQGAEPMIHSRQLFCITHVFTSDLDFCPSGRCLFYRCSCLVFDRFFSLALSVTTSFSIHQIAPISLQPLEFELSFENYSISIPRTLCTDCPRLVVAISLFL
jgi:hypothetical protein